MRALASSIALPFLSHIARQSYSCSAPSDATASTSFLVAYALSIIAHGTLWIDECVDVGWFRLVLVCAGVTFGIAVGVHRIFGPGVWFGVCWTAHAIPSAALWPISFRLVNLSTSRKRVDMSNYRRDVRHAQYDQYPLHHPLWRALLVLWSLQGNAGDAVGCVLSSYIFGTPTNGTQDGEFEQGSGIEVLLHTNASVSATSSPSQRVWLELTIACVFCCACLIPPLHMEAGADDSRSSSSNGVATPPLRSALPTSSANSALHMLLLRSEEEEEEPMHVHERVRQFEASRQGEEQIQQSRRWEVRGTKRTVQATTILIACGACTKTTSYAASNWMPGLDLGYWSYALGSVVGTVISAVVVGAVDIVVSKNDDRTRTRRVNGARRVNGDRHASEPCTDEIAFASNSSTEPLLLPPHTSWNTTSSVVTIVVTIAASVTLVCLAITGCIWVRLWSVPHFALAFGIVASFVSTTLSVCVCSNIGDECGRYGRTTAHADGGATLIAAALQPCARSYFVKTQVGATAALVLILGLMLSLELERSRTRSRSRTRTHKLELEREQ